VTTISSNFWFRAISFFLGFFAFVLGPMVFASNPAFTVRLFITFQIGCHVANWSRIRLSYAISVNSKVVARKFKATRISGRLFEARATIIVDVI